MASYEMSKMHSIPLPEGYDKSPDTAIRVMANNVFILSNPNFRPMTMRDPFEKWEEFTISDHEEFDHQHLGY